jgi:hypothetical protein
MKKIFEGMTPPQIWEYIKNLPIEEREKLLFENDMKKMTKKGPKFLEGMEFNIPVFHAQTQMYLCTNVEEVLDNPGVGKDYAISLSEVKGNYSVPEKIMIQLNIPSDGTATFAHATLLEETKNGYMELSKLICDKTQLSSFGNIKKLFHNLGQKI